MFKGVKQVYIWMYNLSSLLPTLYILESGIKLKIYSGACIGYIVVSGDEYYVLRDTKDSVNFRYKHLGLVLIYKN